MQPNDEHAEAVGDAAGHDGDCEHGGTDEPTSPVGSQRLAGSVGRRGAESRLARLARLCRRARRHRRAQRRHLQLRHVRRSAASEIPSTQLRRAEYDVIV